MSKLAAICAKLKGDAVAVTDSTSPSPFEPAAVDKEEERPLFFSPLPESSDTDHKRHSPMPCSASPSTGDLQPISDGVDEVSDSSIGLLKRKSIMTATGGGASRRKKQRPTSSAIAPANRNKNNSVRDADVDGVENTPDWGTLYPDDTQSMDGSEHSLHIDLHDEPKTLTTSRLGNGSKSPFQQYASSTDLPNPGVIQALGLTRFPGDPFGGSMASQSLAALAHQASASYKAEQQNDSRVASPASLSGDSLNDSHSKTSLAEKTGSGGGGKQKKPIDHSKYLSRYANAQECGSSYCAGMNYRDHFHCLDCPSRIIVKKEEMIRHYKWHKKREDSLQHGFMRYSPFDDCTVKFGPCGHNKKQTHYHCIQTGCNKVYVSTSDVQMHANYHRKASAIIMEGFQRFRATEDCGTPSCDFYSQRTTHFHCRRQGCNFTFKNKADMEKHKTYHQKDEILAKDGFKKYMKYEHCPYTGCAYSKLSNHIHCMRPGCQYVLHSTSQLYPHKRKHEKKDADPFVNYSANSSGAAIYPKPSTPTMATATGSDRELAQTGTASLTATTASDLLSTVARLSQGLIPVMKAEKSAEFPPHFGAVVKEEKTFPINPFNVSPRTASPSQQKWLENNSEATGTTDDDVASDTVSERSAEQLFDKSLNLTPGRVLEPAAMNWKTEKNNRLTEQAKSMMGHFKIASSLGGAEGGATVMSVNKSLNSGEKQSELWKKYLTRYTANDPCNPRCWLLYKDHYHCNVQRCFNAFKNKDGVRDHARLHDNQEKISEQLFTEYTAEQNCGAEGCALSGKKTHFHCKWMNCDKTIVMDEDIFARLDHFQEHEFASRMNQAVTRRNSNTNNPAKAATKRRGRPPKMSNAFPAIFNEEYGYSDLVGHRHILPKDSSSSYSKFDEKTPCFDELCKFCEETHYHCNSKRCYHATNRLDVMSAHSVNFHNYIQIPENYAYFDRNVNCRGVHCSNNRNSCHYHCLRPGCEHSFIRHTTVAQHDKKHREEANRPAKTLPAPLMNFGQSSAIGPPADFGQSGPIGPPADNAAIDESLSQRGLAFFRELNHMAEAARSGQLPAAPNAGDETTDEAKANTAAAGINKTVKASGTFFPKSGKPEESIGADIADDSSNGSSSADEPPPRAGPSGALPYPLSNPADAVPPNAQATAMLNLLAQMLLIQQKSVQAQLTAQQQSQQQQRQQQQQTSLAEENETWQRMLGRMYASPQIPCGNVFCKKKQLEHYHCLECGTAFNKTHESRLKSHIYKHSKYAEQPGRVTEQSLVANTGSPAIAGVAQRSDAVSGLNTLFMEAMAAQQHGQMRRQDAAASDSAGTPATRVSVPDSSTDESPAASSAIQDVMMKALQLQMIGQNRTDAISNHTESHTTSNSQSDKEEGESGMDDAADDDAAATHRLYKRYTEGEDCGSAKCAHMKAGEHYHCLRDECSYSVNEYAKLPQHTKRHDKLDKIMGEDFKLYKQQSDCGRADCEFSSKASHFHCLLCPYICTDASRILPHRKNHNSTFTSPSGK